MKEIFFCSPGPNFFDPMENSHKMKIREWESAKRWERKVKTCIRFNVVINIDVLWTFKVTTEKFNFLFSYF